MNRILQSTLYAENIYTKPTGHFLHAQSLYFLAVPRRIQLVCNHLRNVFDVFGDFAFIFYFILFYL